MRFSNAELQAILDRECIGLAESGLPYQSAGDIIDDVVRDLLTLQKAKACHDHLFEFGVADKSRGHCTCDGVPDDD